MSTANQPLDPYEAPPSDLREIFKKYKNLKPDQLSDDLDLLNFNLLPECQSSISIKAVEGVPAAHIMETFGRFAHLNGTVPRDATVYSSETLPGLFILPSLFPPSIQKELLSTLMHRDLSDSRHKTNLHLHYSILYPEERAREEPKQQKEDHLSFFSLSPQSSTMFQPKDPNIHKALSIKQVLDKKLRWVTLGGQYDWTNKVYPEEKPPDFPRDIADLIEGVFPEMKAQAAIVNLYSPGDTLSLHRDVSEEADRGLASISLGCDCLFVVGLGNQIKNNESQTTQDSSRYMVLRLRSGDAVYMSKESRFAWHGVPKIISNTCPDYLADWPADDTGEFEDWRGWMSNKRINLNVRQINE